MGAMPFAQSIRPARVDPLARCTGLPWNTHAHPCLQLPGVIMPA